MAKTAPVGLLSTATTGYGYAPGTGVNREDLLDLIVNFTPFDHILFAMLPKRRATSTTHEWDWDTLPTVSRIGVAEGADFEGDTPTSPTRDKNYTQIFRFDVVVSGTQQAMNSAGIKNVYLYQVLQGTHAMAKAIEQRIFDTSGTGGNAPGYGGAASQTSPRRFRTLQEFVDASMVVDAALSTLGIDEVDSALENAKEKGLNPEFLFVANGVKSDITKAINTEFGSGAFARTISATEKRQIRSIDIYESDYGTISIIANRSMPQEATGGTQGWGWAWILQRDYLGFAFLRPIQHIPLAKVGDNTRGMLVGEGCTEVLCPTGLAAIKRILT